MNLPPSRANRLALGKLKAALGFRRISGHRRTAVYPKALGGTMGNAQGEYIQEVLVRVVPTVLMLCLVTILLCSCGAQNGSSAGQPAQKQEPPASVESSSATAQSSKPRRLIIDTDTGADDASAIILAASCPDVQVEGVTTLLGNVDIEQSTRNALMALEVAGCMAPVYKGSTTTFNGENKVAFSVFGTDGMGDEGLIHPGRQAEEGDAVDFIVDTVRAHPDEVEILMLGPATNIAKAIERDREAMSHVARIWSMGTSGLGPGNASPVAEFNVYADAPAYKALLDSGIPVVIVGLDMCDGAAGWTSAQFQELAQAGGKGEFVSKSFKKIRDFYALNGSGESVMNCDTLATMCALYPDFVNDTMTCHGSCIVDEGEAYAQVIFYQKGFTYDMAKTDGFTYNVTLVTDVDAQDYFATFREAISAIS
jgi:purine nucleosidase